MLKRLRVRPEWQFFAALPKADPLLAVAWWALLAVSGVMPAVFAVAIGVTVGAVQRKQSGRRSASAHWRGLCDHVGRDAHLDCSQHEPRQPALCFAQRDTDPRLR